MADQYDIPSKVGNPFFDPADVRRPAIALIIVSSFAIVAGFVGFAGDAYLVQSGAVEQMDAASGEPGAASSKIAFRTFYGILLMIASVCVLVGAIQMKNLKNFNLAYAGAMIAAIPCVGPCCLLGIPFGIWALNVLNRDDVRDEFES